MTLAGGTPGLNGVPGRTSSSGSQSDGEESLSDAHNATDDSAWSNPSGSHADECVVDRADVQRLHRRKDLRLGTWNSMNEGTLEIVTSEMERCGVSILGVAELKWIGKGHQLLENGHTIYYHGSEKRKQNGVGVIVNR